MIAAIFISLICHILCFNSIELSFASSAAAEKPQLDKIFFLGQILQPGSDYAQPVQEPGYAGAGLNSGLSSGILIADSSPVYGSGPACLNISKPLLAAALDEKVVYFKSQARLPVKRADSSLMFYPPMPYHFLLYFKDRQAAHMEVAYYISPEGRVLGLRRKISSGNPEVDLLIMRNLFPFLNLYKSNFVSGSWQTVKIDLSP
jgi:hypothetical protein